jgi:YD repeat-containing protein
VGVEHPTGAWYRVERDVDGRVVRVITHEGLLATYAYDRQHDLVLERDARGGARALRPATRSAAPSLAPTRWGASPASSYDALGQVVKTIAPDGTVSHGALVRRARQGLAGWSTPWAT